MKGLKKLSLFIVVAMLSALITLPVSAAETKIVFSDDFSRYSTDDELYESYSNGMNVSDYDLNWVGIAEDNEAHGKVLELSKSADRNNTMIMKYLDEVYTEGQIEISYQVKPSGDLTTLFWLMDSAGNVIDLTTFEPENSSGDYHAKGNTAVSAKWFGYYTPDAWHNVNAVLDLDEKTISVSMALEDGTKTFNTLSFTGFDDLARIRMQIWTANESSSYFDNIKIKAIGANRKEKYNASKLYVEDFEDGDVDGFKEIGGGGAKVTDISGERGYVWEFPATLGGPRQYLYFDTSDKTAGTKTTGKYGIKFSVMPDTKGNLLHGIETSSSMTSCTFYFAAGGNICDGGGTAFGTYSTGVWYDVYSIIDLDNDTRTTIVYGEDGTCCRIEKQFTEDLLGFYFQKWGGSDKGTHYVDDIEIVENPPAFPEEVVVNSSITDNFDAETITSWEFRNDASKSAAAIAASYDTDNGNALGFSHSTANGNEMMWLSLGKAVNRGKIKVSFDVLPADGIYTRIFTMSDGGGDVSTVLAFENNVAYAYATSVGAYESGIWYNCQAEIDVDKKLISGTLKSLTGTTDRQIEFNNVDVSAGFSNGVKSIAFQLWGETDATSYFDNLSVDFEIDSGVLSLSTDKVLIYNDDKLQNNTNADIDSDKIVLDLGSVINPQSMPNMVKLVDNKTGKRVKFNGITEGTKYVMNLVDELTFDTRYTLTVSKNVKSAMGTSLGTDFVYNFDTTDVELELAKSNDGFVDIKYNNLTTEREMTLIYSYYKDGMLKGVDTKPVVIPAGIYGEYVDTGVFEYSEDFDTVKAMLWDNLGELTPMTLAIERDLGNKTLTCDENGDFTVLVVGDPQGYGTTSAMTDWTSAGEDMKILVEKVNPDLVIINGDLTGNTGWTTMETTAMLVKALEENNIAWATTNGNHDPYNKTEYEIYKNFSNNVNQKVSADDENFEETRPVNYVLPIYANDGETPVFAVWGMDTGFEGEKLSDKQVNWYKAKSDELKEMNGGEAVTGIMCMHIPLPQMTELLADADAIHYGTGTNSGANQEAGMFDAIKAQGDVKALIHGHVHENNFIGVYDDILMGFTGKISSQDAKIPTTMRGGRVIKINQYNPEDFTTSWVPVLDGTAQPEIYSDGTLAN